MPKILIYITKRGIWLFLFFGTDSNENRAHIHVGKKDMKNYCKIWLEPTIKVAKKGDLTDAQLKKVVEITEKYRSELLKQWSKFKNGENIRILTINE